MRDSGAFKWHRGTVAGPAFKTDLTAAWTPFRAVWVGAVSAVQVRRICGHRTWARTCIVDVFRGGIWVGAQKVRRKKRLIFIIGRCFRGSFPVIGACYSSFSMQRANRPNRDRDPPGVCFGIDILHSPTFLINNPPFDTCSLLAEIISVRLSIFPYELSSYI